MVICASPVRPLSRWDMVFGESNKEHSSGARLGAGCGGGDGEEMGKEGAQAGPGSPSTLLKDQFSASGPAWKCVCAQRDCVHVALRCALRCAQGRNALVLLHTHRQWQPSRAALLQAPPEERAHLSASWSLFARSAVSHC